MRCVVVRGLGNSLIDLRTFVEDLSAAATARGAVPPPRPQAAPDVPLPPVRGVNNAWIEAVEAPAYPFPIDRTLANRGRVLYLSQCATCHGTTGPGGQYPERVVPLPEVGTDPIRARDFSAAFERHLGTSWVGQYGKTPIFPQARGYVAQPLDGVWATAPYLHNGSVPTMWHLLTPESRPAIWTRTDAGYDQARLGVEATGSDRMPAEATSPLQQRRYYQTGLRGLGNAGHRYPAKPLTEPEKAALIEYLKTL